MAIYQAKSFYNAYINLERIHAQAGGLSFFAPMAINGAFAIEITIKAILLNLNIPFEKEHNLAVLFNLLPEEVQNEIWNWVKEKTPEYADEEKRNEELILISEVFKQCRYIYEFDIPPFDTRFLSSFANATIGVMFKLGLNVDFELTDCDESETELSEMLEKIGIKQ